MPGFDGTGPMGMGPRTGGGRGFCNPWGIGAALRMYGHPRWAPYVSPYYTTYGFEPFVPWMTPEQKLEFLKHEAQALRDELKELEAKIGQLSAERKDKEVV